MKTAETFRREPIADLQRISINALLDGEDETCRQVADELRRRCKLIAGTLCPHCDGTNVEANRETILCQDCDDMYDYQDMRDAGLI